MKKTSKYYGCEWVPTGSKWRCRVKVKGETIHIGMFVLEIDCAKAYDLAVIKYGLKRRLNFPAEPEPEITIPNTRWIRLTQGRWALIDAEDYERVSKYNWVAMKNCQTYYAGRSYTKNGKRIQLSLHIFIFGLQDNGYHIDHWDGNGLNCMKSNLRKCTYSQNQANQRIKVGGTSEYKGVCIEHSAYISSIKYKNKTIRLGRSLCQKHCAYLYNVKSIEIHGEFANPNVIKYNFQITL